MSGIFDQLPDIAVLENLREISRNGFQDALNKTPKTPADLLGSLPDELAAILDAIPGNPADLTQELTGFLGAAEEAAGLDLAEVVQAVADGLNQVQGDVAASPLGSLALASGRRIERHSARAGARFHGGVSGRNLHPEGQYAGLGAGACR